jgi:hypothetical protein
VVHAHADEHLRMARRLRQGRPEIMITEQLLDGRSPVDRENRFRRVHREEAWHRTPFGRFAGFRFASFKLITGWQADNSLARLPSFEFRKQFYYNFHVLSNPF